MEAFSRKPDAEFSKKAALAALAHDAARDITNDSCIPAKMGCTGRIIAKSNFVLCGILEANAIFASRKVRVAWKFAEGETVKRGAVVCRLSGNCRAVLACERTALNYLALLSGIATKSASASKRFGKGRIAATRKTLPVLSDSEKRAVLVGGCLTHRMSLADGILVKDNHLAAIMKERKVARAKAVGIAVHSFKRTDFVEVEVSSLSQAVAALEAGASAILVDNVSPSQLAKIAKAVRQAGKKTIVEASGGITLANAGRYLAAGADFVSTSELTMEISPANLSLEIDYF